MYTQRHQHSPVGAGGNRSDAGTECKHAMHKGLLREEAWGRGKADFKPSISQKAETEGSCTGKKENKGELNRSKPAERDGEGEKHCRNETVPVLSAGRTGQICHRTRTENGTVKGTGRGMVRGCPQGASSPFNVSG